MAGLHVTPALIEAAYELLRITPPFRGWKLPHADDVQFVVLPKNSTFVGAYHGDDEKPSWHRISIAAKVTTYDLLSTVAHEMVHMKLGVDYYDKRRQPADHGKTFNRMADQVCRWHQFDRGVF